jgi:hypothetical protein
MAKIAARYTVTLDRTDGGEPIEERDVLEVQLRFGTVTIMDADGRLFGGDAWSSLEVRRIEDTARADILAPPPPRQRRQGRPVRQAGRPKR